MGEPVCTEVIDNQANMSRDAAFAQAANDGSVVGTVYGFIDHVARGVSPPTETICAEVPHYSNISENALSSARSALNGVYFEGGGWDDSRSTEELVKACGRYIGQNLIYGQKSIVQEPLGITLGEKGSVAELFNSSPKSTQTALRACSTVLEQGIGMHLSLPPLPQPVEPVETDKPQEPEIVAQAESSPVTERIPLRDCRMVLPEFRQELCGKPRPRYFGG